MVLKLETRVLEADTRYSILDDGLPPCNEIINYIDDLPRVNGHVTNDAEIRVFSDVLPWQPRYRRRLRRLFTHLVRYTR